MSLIGKEITEFEAQAFHENEFKTIKKEDLIVYPLCFTPLLFLLPFVDKDL